MSQMPEMQKNIVSSRNLLLAGAKLGFLGSIWGSLLFSALYFVVPFLFEAPEQISTELFKDFFGFYQIGFLLTFFVSVIPSVLAGLTNAWTLASIENLSSRGSVFTGIIIGCLFCLVPTGLGAISVEMQSALILNHPPLRAEVVRDMITVTVTSTATAALVGSWHSLKIYRYLTSPA